MEIKLTPYQEPVHILNDRDKIYFATARKNAGKQFYVYALVSNLSHGRTYDLMPHTEIYAFDDPARADFYHGAINQIMAHQAKTKMYAAFLQYVSEYISQFNDKIR